MGTTCRDVITYGLRQSQILAGGEELGEDDAADGLVVLQSLYDLMFASGMFGRLTDVYVSADYEAKERERVTAPSGVAVTFPETLVDECSGSPRAPFDLAAIETVINGVRVVKLYDRTGWVSMLGLGLDDEAPLAGRGVMGLSAALATSGAFMTMFGAQPSRDVTTLARAFTMAISQKFGTTQRRQPAEYS